MAYYQFLIPVLLGVGLNIEKFDLSVEEFVGEFLLSYGKTKLTGELVAWCLRKVLEDQYTENKS